MPAKKNKQGHYGAQPSCLRRPERPGLEAREKTMYAKLAIALFSGALFSASMALGQPSAAPAPAAFGQLPGLPSPVVAPDGKITFNLYAPQATSVSLDGDYPLGTGYNPSKEPRPLVKNEKGVWSITVGPLKSDIYSYYFIVNGVHTLDPRNPIITRDGVRYANWVTEPGEVASRYQFNEAPHGDVSAVWYPSPTLKLTRRATVYTPPGYAKGSQRYPVLYLIHGGGGDEEAWRDMGRAPEIFDNLMAAGKMTPMIVVMPNGNEWEQASPNDISAQGNPGHLTAGPELPESVVHDLAPFIDQTYRTKADRNDRAIAGLSRGGAQTLLASLNHLDQFSWVGVFSGGLPLLPGVLIHIPMPADAASRRGPDIGNSIDPAKFKALFPRLGPDVNSKLHLFYLTIGNDDGLVESWQAARKVFDDAGVKYTWVERPGYGHEWAFWRLALADFGSRLFKPAK